MMKRTEIENSEVNESAPASLTDVCKISFKTGTRGRKRICEAAPEPPPSFIPGSLPRVTRLMALAIKFDAMLSRGEVRDFADLARLGYVSRARITQIMNLLTLAPDIQEALLSFPRTTTGQDPIREHNLRPIVGVPFWNRQRKMWKAMKNNRLSSP